MGSERQRIGIFGGTFNPPHCGHIAAANACVRELALDKLLLVPAGIPPHKALPENTASPAHRLAMVQLAARRIAKADVCRIELDREGPSYTADTVRELADLYPHAQLWLIVGGDMFMTFGRWMRPREITARCRIAAVARTEAERDALCAQAAALEREWGAECVVLRHKAVEVSSTELRAGRLAHMLPEDIAAYMARHGLYGAPEPDLDRYRQAARDWLSAERLAHTLGCEAEAEKLALWYGADPVRARAAALLHDLTKDRPFAEQLKYCQKYGIILEYDMSCAPAIIHADTAAAVAAHEFGAPSDVVTAIRRHSTGEERMSLLDKIVYVADVIEPGRAFEGVCALRALAYADLDRALCEMLARTIERLTAAGKALCPATVRALGFLQKERARDEAVHQ